MASTLTQFRCGRCESTVAAASATRCPECAGSLYGRYEWPTPGAPDTVEDRPGIWRYAPVLPPREDDGSDPIALCEGDAPLVACPELAETAGLGGLTVQDDGRSTTASGLADRGASVVATLAYDRDLDDPVLASTGASAVALAAYVARGGRSAIGAGTDPARVHAFVPARSPFAHKALYNVHGGDMRVVGGRYDDAVAALGEAQADETDPAADWTPVGPAAVPHWVEGAKTAALEAIERLERVPDAVVAPVGHGVALAGWWRGLVTLEAAGRIDALPALYGVQAGGCAPIVDAVESETAVPDPVETPDTVSGALEVPDPALGDLALRAIRETDGGAVAVSDDSLLEAGVRVSRTAGLELGTPGAAAVAGLGRLVETGALEPDERVLVYNPSNATPEADLFRSHLMRRGE